MKDHRKRKSFGLMAASVLFLAGSNVAAQQLGPGAASLSLDAPAHTGSKALPSWSPDAATTSVAAGSQVGSVLRWVTGRPPFETGERLPSVSSISFYVGEVRKEPPGLAGSPTSQEAPGSARSLLPPAEQAAPLAFHSTRDRYWQPRPVSAFPEKASPGMFPGSRLRGPFEQIYPRPFPGGGQP